jgi:hypothetical protein
MYYIIYDNEYPMCAAMSYDDIIGMAEDVLGQDKYLADVGINPLVIPGAIAVKPSNDAQMLLAAKTVLEEHWGFFGYYSEQDLGDFLWYATEYDIEEQAKALIRLHDPEFANAEFGE